MGRPMVRGRDALGCIEVQVLAFTNTGPASRDFKFRDQIREAAASAPSNISEAFGRFRPRETVRFLEFAYASLQETQNHLIDARDRGYLAEPLFSRLRNLARAALGATLGFLRQQQRKAEEMETRRRAASRPPGRSRRDRSRGGAP